MIAVLLSHTFSRIFPNGYLGVDVFFVISGFVLAPALLDIAKTTNKSEKILKVRKFIRKRIFRLLPALVAFWALISTVFIVFGDIQDFRIVSNQVLLSIFQVGNIGSHYLQGSYFQDFSNPWVHTWSLSVEFQLYLLLCIIALLSKKKKDFTLIIPLFAGVSGMLFLAGGSNNNSLWLDYYSPVTRVWEVFVGTILYITLHQKERIKRTSLSIPSQLGLIGIAIFPVNLPRLATTVVIIAITCILLASYADNKNGILENRLLIGIGNRSYSIYLVHVPIFYVLERFPYLEKLTDSSSIELLNLIITFLIADQLYKRIENKYREAKLSVVNRKSLAAFSITALLTASLLHFSGGKIANSMMSEGDTPPWVSAVGCQIFGNLDTSHKTPCLIYQANKQSRKVVLLLGDSHAAVYKNTLREMARESNTTLYASTQYGCPFFIKEDITAISTGARNCLEHNISIQKWITNTKPHSIVLSSRPGYVLEGFDFSAAELLDYEVKAVTEMLELGIKVTKIGPVPETERYQSIAQKHFPLLFEPSKFQLSLNQNEYWERQDIGRNFRFLNVFGNICKDECPKKIHNQPIYFDSNHLNDYGASIALETFRF